MPRMSLNLSRPILVRRSNSEQGCKGAPQTMRSLTASTTMRHTFGGAWCPSSQVHHRSLVDLLPSHTADLVLRARMAGPLSRLPSSQLTIKWVLVAYGSSSTRWHAAHGRALSLCGAKSSQLLRGGVGMNICIGLHRSTAWQHHSLRPLTLPCAARAAL